MKKTLEGLRRKIAELDGRIVGLLDERAHLAMETAVVKERMGEKLYQPGREAEVLANVTKRRKVFPPESLAAVYREIIGTSLSLEKRFSAAVFGPEATYTHLAAVKHFGRATHLEFEPTIADVFLRVEKEDVDVGVVPVENSIEGAIVHTLDRLVESTLAIAAEILLPVRHHLMIHPHSMRRGKPIRIAKIASHPQAIGQCRNFLEAYYAGVPVRNAPSTASAAQEAARKPGVAAIASELAAEQYGLEIIKSGIEDFAGNTTRFLVIRPSTDEPASRPTGRDKTSVAFSVKDRPGALFRMLEPFQRHGINLSKIESRPARVKAWRYVFFIDMEGHASDPKLAKALKSLERECQFYRLLGSYPAGR